MGIDTVAQQIVGWELDYEAVAKWCGDDMSCGGDEYLCFCGRSCQNSSRLPAGFELTATSPWYDCPDDDRAVYLSLVSVPRDVEALADLVRSSQIGVDFAAAQKLAVQLGANDGPAQLIAAPHVF